MFRFPLRTYEQAQEQQEEEAFEQGRRAFASFSTRDFPHGQVFPPR